MSLYKRGSVWQYLFYLHGKRYKGSTGIKILGRSNERLAQEIEAEKKRQARAGEPVAPLRPTRPLTVREFIEEFSTWVKTINRQPKTRTDYLNGCRLILASPLAGMRSDHVTVDDIQAVKFHHSPYSTNCALRTLRRAMNRAVRSKRIPFAPEIRLVNAPRRERMVTTEDEGRLLKAIEEAARSRRYKKRAPSPLGDVLQIMLDSGMRDGEVVKMRIEHINWSEEVCFNPQGKTRKARRQVPLSKRVMALICTRVNDRQEGWVFPSQKAPSGHIELRGLQKQFRKIAQQLRIPSELKLYCARHTFGTVAMAETRNPALVMETMGHEDLKTTMGYMHPEVSQIKQIIDRRNAKNQALMACGHAN